MSTGVDARYKSNRQRDFLDFVLSHFVEEGVDALDPDKLSPLLQLKYNAIADAADELARPSRFA